MTSPMDIDCSPPNGELPKDIRKLKHSDETPDKFQSQSATSRTTLPTSEDTDSGEWNSLPTSPNTTTPLGSCCLSNVEREIHGFLRAVRRKALRALHAGLLYMSQRRADAEALPQRGSALPLSTGSTHVCFLLPERNGALQPVLPEGHTARDPAHLEKVRRLQTSPTAAFVSARRTQGLRRTSYHYPTSRVKWSFRHYRLHKKLKMQRGHRRITDPRVSTWHDAVTLCSCSGIAAACRGRIRAQPAPPGHMSHKPLAVLLQETSCTSHGLQGYRVYMTPSITPTSRSDSTHTVVKCQTALFILRTVEHRRIPTAVFETEMQRVVGARLHLARSNVMVALLPTWTSSECVICAPYPHDAAVFAEDFNAGLGVLGAELQLANDLGLAARRAENPGQRDTNFDLTWVTADTRCGRPVIHVTAYANDETIRIEAGDHFTTEAAVCSLQKALDIIPDLLTPNGMEGILVAKATYAASCFRLTKRQTQELETLHRATLRVVTGPQRHNELTAQGRSLLTEDECNPPLDTPTLHKRVPPWEDVLVTEQRPAPAKTQRQRHTTRRSTRAIGETTDSQDDPKTLHVCVDASWRPGANNDPNGTELELRAIREELRLARQVIYHHLDRGYQQIHLFTDCTEALRCLIGPPRKHSTAHAIKKTCASLERDNGAIGHPGNERAHELSNEAALHRYHCGDPTGPVTLRKDPHEERQIRRQRRRQALLSIVPKCDDPTPQGLPGGAQVFVN
ncbi:hypothetical protein HPB47_003327 [Ixodes persulcatus]|uniref:Uncharacterized protein n=1 Tax=Ixodes persulcatus TaxID=34615 RepID=A0AC60PJS9_IXOPE|nr:hypothetical protein HPB47_003327 [Ixodes persulcatus]